MSLCNELRAATQLDHCRLEALPLAQSMADGTVNLEDYAGLLRRLLAVHRLWEAEVAHVLACEPCWTPSQERAEMIGRDLEVLGFEPVADDHFAALDWFVESRELSKSRPELWLGVIYLFEGSRMGSMMLLRSLSGAFGVSSTPGSGLDYHLAGLSTRVADWHRFKATLDSLPFDDEQRQAIILGANLTFRLLHEIYNAPIVAPVAT